MNCLGSTVSKRLGCLWIQDRCFDEVIFINSLDFYSVG